MTPPIRVRKTPYAYHPYTATMKGFPVYGWGNTPDEARAKLLEVLARARPRKAKENVT